MAFKNLQTAATPSNAAQDRVETDIETVATRPQSRQLALRLNGARPVIVPNRPQGRTTAQEIQTHVAHLAGQIEALRQQLREHSSDRIAMLLREMIDERMRKMDRWVVQEEAWDRRVAAIEDAISERDTFRRREAELLRERDEARRAAAAAAAQRDSAQRSAEAARREAEAVRRAAEQAQSEQLRLRAERELDSKAWGSERRDLSRKLDELQDRRWLSRLIGR